MSTAVCAITGATPIRPRPNVRDRFPGMSRTVSMPESERRQYKRDRGRETTVQGNRKTRRRRAAFNAERRPAHRSIPRVLRGRQAPRRAMDVRFLLCWGCKDGSPASGQNQYSRAIMRVSAKSSGYDVRERPQVRRFDGFRGGSIRSKENGAPAHNGFPCA